MAELEPCPFCGSEANMVDEGSECAPDRFWACCPNPSCFVEGTGVYSTEEKAAEAWNARWERTCKCEQCGHSFKPTNPEQKYCSKECKRAAHLARRLRDEGEAPLWFAKVCSAKVVER